jgi:hypothetical protein
MLAPGILFLAERSKNRSPMSHLLIGEPEKRILGRGCRSKLNGKAQRREDAKRNPEKEKRRYGYRRR